MAKVKDPVCGMEINAADAAATSSVGGETRYFCSTQCKQKFDASPDKYERNLTQKGGVTAPRFGSAGSGGLEYEGPPGRSGE